MAGLAFFVTSGEVTFVANTAKSFVQIIAPAQQRVLVSGVIIMGKNPAGGTDTPAKVRVTRNSANFGTWTGNATIGKVNPGDAETIQTTAKYNATVEPTTPTDSGIWFEVNPQTGFIWDIGFGKAWEIPGGQSLQLELTSNSTPTYVATIYCEE